MPPRALPASNFGLLLRYMLSIPYPDTYRMPAGKLFQMRVFDTESLAELIVASLSDILSYRVVHEMALICTCKYHSSTILSPIAC
jgi:hypothetical protein